MTALSGPLQAAVFARLAGFAPLTALVGPHVYDALPPGAPPPLYVALGPEVVRDRSDATGRGAEHEIAVSVVTEGAGFAAAKAAAGAVSDALVDANLPLSRGRLVFLHFLRSAALRSGASRRVDLFFRARVEDAG